MTEFLRFFPSRHPGPEGLRVLWITNMWPDETRPYYGNFIKSQADSLWDLGICVDVLYLRGLLSQRAYFTTFPALRHRVRGGRYDLIHAHYGHTAAVAVGAGSRPLIISFCGEDLLRAPRQNGRNTLKSTIESVVFRQLPRFADATITKSHEMEMSLPQTLRSMNHVLPNGVDTNLFQRGSRVEARRRIGWDPDTKVVMFLGNPADPRKRVELARDAMRGVTRKRPDARLEVVFGKDPDQIPTYMSAADCLVFPSRSEGSPNAVKEAMAAELPIVATPVGDIPERFDGVAGCFVRPPEVEAFADALLQALDMGRAPEARRAILPISLEQIANRLCDIYTDVVGTHAPQPLISDRRSIATG